MESVLMKYLLNSGFLTIDEMEEDSIFKKDIEDRRNKLKNILDKSEYEEVSRLSFDIVRHMFNLRDKECFKMLYLGIVLGMEVNDFVNKENEEW